MTSPPAQSGAKSPHSKVCALLFFLFVLFLSLGSAGAAAGLDHVVIMAGTTTVDGQGRHWAYLTWMATEPQALRSRVLAVYAKSGEAGSASLYQREAVVMLQTDPTVLQPLLQRSIQLGQDLNFLEETVNNQFEKLVPDPKLPLAQKLSAVIRGSLDQPDHFKNLVLMARVHPAVALCLGWAHAALIPGPVGTASTFEVRVYDPANDRDLGVIGRATVRAGQPVVLPAPGRPVEVPDTSPKGDLNARMRWATPDDLRRLSMLQHGFNVYRVPAAVAHGNGWHLAPPTTSALLNLVQSNPAAHRLNRVPLLNPRDYTAAEAANLAADGTNFFYADWNDRFNPATTMPQGDFVNGAQFYYFLTARDLLGRDGFVSPGTLMTICDRMPPGAPRHVRVVNHYDYQAAQPQRLQVIWNQNENKPGDQTVSYYVYRWKNLPEFHASSGNPAFNRIAGPIAHVPGAATNSYLDQGFGAPSLAADAGSTVWYTVVAMDNGACAPGGNRSPHSAPAFGVLRDRVGPEAGGGRIEITCTEPAVEFLRVDPDLPVPSLATNARHYRLVAERRHASIAWAEFHYDIAGSIPARTLIARQLFTPGAPFATVDFALPRAGLPPAASPRFWCRVGADNGKVSEFVVTSTVGPTPNQQIRPVLFAGTMVSRRTIAGGDCAIHDPHGSGDGTNDEICVTAALTAGTREVKFYRRVENGPLTMFCQREADGKAGTTLSCCNGSIPAQPSDICYFVQLFDEHGNAGPMTRIGCVQTAPNAPLATPILSPITSAGTSTNARMRLQWFCPPYGVERFEVWIAGYPLPAGQNISPDLTLTNEVELGLPLPGVVPAPAKLQMFVSRRIGPALGAGPVFTTDADVIVGNRYSVFIRAVGKDGSISPRSNAEQFSWHVTPQAPDARVPWPARSLPAVTLTNFPGVMARLFHTNDPVFLPFRQQSFEGVGIRVGAVTMPVYPPLMTNAIAGGSDPVEHVYRSARDLGSLFPLAVYRAQVANPAFPEISGDVVQVTPMMEQIAFDRSTTPQGANAVFVHDPFIRLVPTQPTPAAQDWELYLLDTQPVVEDAAYQYFLVRFDAETREITEVMPTNPVQIVP